MLRPFYCLTPFVLSLFVLIGREVSAQEKFRPSEAQLAMLRSLEQRIANDPDHSESWRSLGRMQNALSDRESALVSTRRAVELDPFNAAAHFDLGQILIASDTPSEAAYHFDRVFEIAPSSLYAEQLRDRGIAATSTSDRQMDATKRKERISLNVQPASYEIQTFDGADNLEQRFEELESEVIAPGNRLRVFFETGVLYNSNVTLTPISRELAQSESASFQAFANPDIDYKLVRTETTRLGPLFRGYFTANESDFKAFNLASFQPGTFAERDFAVLDSDAIGRLEYIYANDLFDGDKVGDRHLLTTSVTLIRPDLDAYYGYFSIASSNFTNDGVLPSQTSLDGTTITAGISRFFQTGRLSIPTHSLGVDLESADTEGSDYRYKSINLHGSTGWLISDRWKLVPNWGIGYRDYADFTGPVDRNEFFWRVQGRLQYAVTPFIGIALVAGHDRFASDNDDFDTERTEGGVVINFIR